MKLSVTVNGEAIAADVEPRMSLADFLRDKCGLTGTHLGCEHGVCGACTIMLNGKPSRSCITYAVQCADKDVRTIEGFDDDAVMASLRTEFSRQHALQCGFCTPGMLITARDIVTRLGDPGEPRVREELAGNLCRCTGYAGIVAAVRNVGMTRSASVAAVDEVPTPRVRLSEAANDTVRPAVPLPEAPPAATAAPSGGTKVTHSFTVSAAPDRVWAFFRDLPAITACIPGAELLSHDDKSFAGRITMKVGPVRAQLEGTGVYAFEDRTRTGSLNGSGVDRLSGSRVRGTLTFQLAPGSETNTRIDAALHFTVQGLLAQFSRSSIAKEFTARVLDEFAQRASVALSGGTSVPTHSRLGFLALLRWWLASLFRR